jgi:DNA-binding NarL/FixJ family response regulator
LNEHSIRVLVVDDQARWCQLLSRILSKDPKLQVVGLASDGVDAVDSAKTLQPDLILLDVGLPKSNGLEAARQIRKVAPRSEILFVSENRSPDIVEVALNTGAGGYVVKSDAASDLLPAVRAVLQGTQFVSDSLTVHGSNASRGDQTAMRHCHEVAFYADEGSVIDGYAAFIESALKSGNAVIVIVTESHRETLLPRLEADGVNVAAAIEQGSYIPWDAADALTRLIVDDMPDPVRCEKTVDDLIMGAAKVQHGQVVVCGEIAPTLLFKGNAEGAIRLEHMWDEITRGYGVHTLCGYVQSAFQTKESSPIFERICAEHSAVRGLGY